jgi:hypothetical protein
VSAADQSKNLTKLLKSLASAYPDAPPLRPESPAVITAMDELVYSFLLWESTHHRAANAYKRLRDAFVDDNELRVTRNEEIMAVLGKTYPHAEERVMRLRAALRDVYLREHAVSLEKAKTLAKREARKYVESLEGMHPFVAARVVLLGFGGHAVPLEDRLLDKLAEAGVVDDGADVVKAQGSLERMVKAADAAEAAQLLQALSEDTGADVAALTSRSPSRSSAGAGGSKKKKTAPKRSASASVAKKAKPAAGGSARSKSRSN